MSGADRDRAPASRVRVLLAAPTFGAYGGMEAFVLTLAENLCRDDRFYVRVCFKHAGGTRPDRAMESRCHGLPVEFCVPASRALWDAIGWADVVHAQNASPDIALMAALRRRPLVLSVHNVLPRAPRLRRLSWQLSARLASARWYNSLFVWRTWEPRRVRTSSARVAPMSPRPAADVPIAARRGFVFVGRLVAGKGADVLLEAYARAKLDPDRCPLTIVGDGPQRAQLEAQAARVRRTGVRMTGFLDGPAKAEIMAGARWLVVPSHWDEPFGLVAHEARALGVPCIVTRDGGLPEAAGRDALVCAAGDVDTLAGALQEASCMPEPEYEARAQRTRRDLIAELPPPLFYADQYLRLAGHP